MKKILNKKIFILDNYFTGIRVLVLHLPFLSPFTDFKLHIVIENHIVEFKNFVTINIKGFKSKIN